AGRPEDAHPCAGPAGRAVQVRDDAAFAHAGQGRAHAQVPRLRRSPPPHRTEGDRGREEGEGGGPRLTLLPRPISGRGQGRGHGATRPLSLRATRLSPSAVETTRRSRKCSPNGGATRMPGTTPMRVLTAAAAAVALAGCGAPAIPVRRAGSSRWS